MTLKQISLSLPEQLFKAAKEYTNEFGYKNLQEFILALLRKRVIMERVERYQSIEEDMKAGNAKRFNQKDAVKYLKNL